MRKFITLSTLFLFFVQILTPVVIYADNIDHPQIQPNPIIKWGNSAYHDSLGARDPFVVKDNESYYLYYDCIEDLLNPSFEENLGTNGWGAWQATINSTSEKYLFGQKSLKVINLGVDGGGAYTDDYFFGSNKLEENLAMPGGLEVTPETAYIASAYFWAEQGKKVKLWIKQYRDDPKYYWENWVADSDSVTEKIGNSNWQRISARFTTRKEAGVITISLVPDINAISYWDGVQLERTTTDVPSAFPANIDFNQRLEDVIGWKSCLAVSNDGINFDKKGQISIVGTRGVWEAIEKPGWVGSSGMYLSPFLYQGYWYSYTWVAGYRLGTEVYTTDPIGSQSHRKWYGDRRAFLPNGNPSRSGLVRGNSLFGPFERISQTGPLISPNPTTGWGQIYVTANGIPQKISDKWVLFLAGTPGNIFNWRTITPGLAIGDSPLGPWVVTDYTPILPPDYQGVVPEGPIYYRDPSGTHFLFLNDIAAGSAVAYWTTDPLSKWSTTNKKTIINKNQTPWSNGESPIGLSTVIEKDDNTLFVYFATRPSTASVPNGWNKYLFHDIGLISFALPLISPLPGDLDRNNKVDISDYNILLQNFGNTACGNVADIDGNCKVDIFDYNVLVGNFGPP